jgi:hypothetical protein
MKVMEMRELGNLAYAGERLDLLRINQRFRRLTRMKRWRNAPPAPAAFP